MSLIWVDSDGVLTGYGPVESRDPGTGPERYQRALDGLRRSGRDVAFASFTFDITESGSVLAIPESTRRSEQLPTSANSPSATIRDDGIAVWRTGFEKAMLEIDTGRVDKVVLARRVVLETEPGPDEAEIVGRLRAKNPNCYLFSVAGLVGASPELLVSLRDGRVSTLALAGTATDPEQLETVKISEEHRHVSRSVIAGLERHLSDAEITEQVIVPHGAMSHVGTRIEGRAKPGTTVADILADLHPTAAVAGTPTTEAIDIISEIEPGSRGRYSGPIGWMNTVGEGVFAIALRCGQISGSTMTLFAGGGLVSGSEEAAELEETDLKLVPMLEALGHTLTAAS